MNANQLRELIETLQKRISNYRKEFEGNETLTRYALVDPLLRGMEWDTGDPAQVRPEYSLGGGRADYALFKNVREDRRPSLVVEAKPLGGVRTQGQGPLKGMSPELPDEQAMRYCINDGIPYFVVTDGQKWDVYQTLKKGRSSERKIDDFSFDLTMEWALASCLSAAEALWRCNPNPPGTKRVVDGGISLDGDGYELTRTGKRRQKKGKDLPPYPSDAMRRLDRTFFLSREGFVLNSDGKQNKQHRGKHPLHTKQVGGQGCCKSGGRVEERERRGPVLL